jgi:hypothetical protein
MVPGYEIQTISSGGRSQNSCPTKLEEQSNCIARIFIILYNENKAPLNLGFVHGHSSLPHFLNPSSQTGQRLVPMKLPERWIEAAQSEWKHVLPRQLLALSYIFAIQQDVTLFHRTA